MSFSVNSSGFGQTQALSSSDHNQVLVRRHSIEGGPSFLSFACSRDQLEMDTEIHRIFNNAIREEAFKDMVVDPRCSEGEMNQCGNTQGYLWECRCKDFNRTSFPERRSKFENDVISSILKSAKISNTQTQALQESFEFNLAVFCSGGLLGERILLFKLVNELRTKGRSGVINLFLIDLIYQSVIDGRNPHLEQLIHQFTNQICGCLPPNIKVTGAFFGKDESYIKVAKEYAQFKHDLLIGADMQSSEKFMGHKGLQDAANPGAPRPIVLVSNRSIPCVCRIDHQGKPKGCYPVLGEPRSSEQTAQIVACALVAVGAVAVVVTVVILFRNKHRARCSATAIRG